MKTLNLRSTLYAVVLCCASATPTWADIFTPSESVMTSSFSGPVKAVLTNNTELPGSTFLTISPVPEPGEWAMLLAGLGLMGYRLRRHVLDSMHPATKQFA